MFMAKMNIYQSIMSFFVSSVYLERYTNSEKLKNLASSQNMLKQSENNQNIHILAYEKRIYVWKLKKHQDQFQIQKLLELQKHITKFFHMKNHTYTLATNYQNLPNEAFDNLNSNRHSSNIFSQQNLRLETPRQLPLLRTKQYNIVGLKELKNYQNKIRKDRKNTCRKPTYQNSERNTIRSQVVHQKQFLNKKDIIENLPVIINSNNQKKKLKKVKLGSLLTQIQHQNQYFGYKMYRQKTVADVQFSVNRLKESIDEKNKEWNRLLNRISRSDSKFPSVYRKIEDYRTLVQSRQKSTILHELPNNCSNKWPQLLRNEMRVNQMSQRKQIIKTIHRPGELSARGTSKLKSQEKWLEDKEEDGYEFKLLKQTTSTHKTINCT